MTTPKPATAAKVSDAPTTAPTPTGLDLLRVPFPDHLTDHKPQPLSRDDKNKGRCEDTPDGRKFSADRIYCGAVHTRSVHLSYVGHAALTSRLLDADPTWNWEPFAYDADGLPKFDSMGGLWLRLTVCGVTRPGYGDAQGKTGPNAVKEAIGDGLRNAGMRFGAALDLWSKSDLNAAVEADEGEEWVVRAKAQTDPEKVKGVWEEARAAGMPVPTLDKISAVWRELNAKVEQGA